MRTHHSPEFLAVSHVPPTPANWSCSLDDVMSTKPAQNLQQQLPTLVERSLQLTLRWILWLVAKQQLHWLGDEVSTLVEMCLPSTLCRRKHTGACVDPLERTSL
jgi:hypothetical protein